MAMGPEKLVLQKIQQLLRQGNWDELSDGDLLREYVLRKDTAALERLIGRLSPMVWGVCRRLLREQHEAEDAFQTTFLVLVRKAHTIVNRQAVGGWVYRVAYHAATRAQLHLTRRRAREKRLTEMSGAEPSPGDLRETTALLDQEINKLSEKHREVLSLCCLQGKSNEQAAHELGCPVGTVAVRLSRARDQLRTRLARCGLALSTAQLANLLAETALALPVPATLLRSTVAAATVLPAGGTPAAAFSSSVLAAGDEVVRHLAWRKLKLAAVCLAGGLSLAGSGWFVHHTLASRWSSTGPALAAPAVKAVGGDTAKTPPVRETVRSGPKVGDSLRGRVLTTLHLNGPDKGGRGCLIGKYGTRPVALVFARNLTAPLQRLIEKLDAACSPRADSSLRSFVVCAEPVQSRLNDWLATSELRQLVITVGGSPVFREYAIAEQAEVTVVLYVNSKVIVNHAFTPGQLTNADIDTILKDLAKILP
jgi:RNA polymerase sigma factor (sigma-70 family)